ncbi:transcriptional repressor LexA [Acetivibrio sp.]|uniref:transcriptional repressor LexA n=1 Tax=Acetivibrio sp. TaxID=1872092 RepID=UPI002D1FAD2B|nr:transcriptional repressor LexA [Acetivibrio sp.]
MSSDFDFLTAKQKKVYMVIESFIKSKGIPPTVKEIGELVGEKTPGAVQGILNRLEQKGVIKREVGMARSIQLVNNNSQYAPHVYLPKIKKVSQRNVNDLLSIYNIINYIPVPSELFQESSDCFVIDCPDNSLLESGIKYGDLLVISRNYELKDGDIVLILYENHVLLRYYTHHENPDLITLKADSELLGKEVFNRNEVTIIGKLVGKYTKY